MRANATLQILNEAARWRARDVRYYAGGWDDVLSVLPEFELTPFRAGPEEPSNPFLRTVVRWPLSAVERPIPVGVVSHRYALVQHRDVAARCREGLAAAGMDAAGLRYEVGVSALGEWMNLRACPTNTRSSMRTARSWICASSAATRSTAGHASG